MQSSATFFSVILIVMLFVSEGLLQAADDSNANHKCLDQVISATERAVLKRPRLCSKYAIQPPILVEKKGQKPTDIKTFEVDVICANRISGKYEVTLNKKCLVLKTKLVSTDNPWK